MPRGDTINHQVSSQSTLSAEAKSFEPCGGITRNNKTIQNLSATSVSQIPAPHVPPYVMNCYPFVQGQQAQQGNPRLPMAPWQNSGHPPGLGMAGKRMHVPTSISGIYSPQVGGKPPHNISGAHQPRPVGYVPQQTYNHAGVSAPHVLPHFMDPSVFPMPNYSGFCQHYSQMPSPPHGGWRLYPPAEFAGQCPPQRFYSTGHLAPYGNPGNVDPSEWNGSEPVRLADRKSKKKKECSNMVSIGVQNESGVFGHGSSRKRGHTKTIILMDAAIQTDFSEEFANLTLAEKPNSLFEKNRSWRDRYIEQSCTSTDSELVDSDSGYSSPLHRKNQASNSTQPRGVTTYMPHTYLPADSLTIMHKQGHAASYPSYLTAPGVGMGLKTPYQNFPNPSTTYTAAPYIQGFTPVPGKHNSRITGVSKSLGTKTNASFPQNTESSMSKTEPEDDDDETVGGKKKQRRRRRRRRTVGGEDAGVLSDEPLELSHAYSSSNISRASTDGLSVETDLHFDDVDFPELMSAASGLHGPTTRQITPGLSYSDILKSQVVSPLSQESISMSSMDPERSRYMSPPPGMDRRALQQGAKESKNARKRRKRRELADLAAETELAEITLEQQVLKELCPSGVPQPTRKSSTPKSQPSGKKSKQPISFNFAEILDSLEKQQKESQQQTQKQVPNKEEPKAKLVVANPLDANAPVKRGKEREVPKVKKPSPLKKVILKEREEKKRLRTLDDGLDTESVVCDGSKPDNEEDVEASTGVDESEPEPETNQEPVPGNTVTLDSDLSQEGKSVQIHDTPDVQLLSTSPCQDVEDSNDDGSDTESLYSSRNSHQITSHLTTGDSDLSQEAGSSKTSSMDYGESTPLSADMSPISQTSPISMSPLSPGGSPLSSGVNSPVATNNPFAERKPQVVMKIHSRRFREYCTQILDKEIDDCCTSLLQDLVRFQDRLFHKDPTKAKSKRRIVLGLREVTKHLKLRKIKCVIISPNLERIQSKGGLDEVLNAILQICTEQHVPFVFALGRRALGRACAKLVPVSVVGVFNYEGTEETFHRLMDLTEKARNAYDEMVSVLEKEAQEQTPTSSSNSNSSNSVNGIFPQLFAHMGHSRTPSACSAISFTSSILSEPISENYPHSEPETDSRGYEIIQEVKQSTAEKQKGEETVLDSVNSAKKNKLNEEEVCPESPSSPSIGPGCKAISQALHEIDEKYEADDEGQEADNEDLNDKSWRSNSQTPVPASFSATEGSLHTKELHFEDEEDADTVQELPHIDSIHSSVVDLSIEILSQHSSKTNDISAEVLSSHSSKTLGENNAMPNAIELLNTSTGKACSVDSVENKEVGAAVTPRIHTIDKAARIESWVAASQHQLEKLTVDSHKNSETDKSEMCNKRVSSDGTDRVCPDQS